MIRYAPLPVRINPNVVITYYNVATTRFTRHNWNIPTVHLREFILSDRKQISSAGEKYRDLFTWRSTKESYFHDHCVMGNEYYKVWEDFINQLYVPRCEVLVLNFIQPLAQSNHLVNLPDWNEVNFCQFYPESTKSVAEIRKPLFSHLLSIKLKPLICSFEGRIRDTERERNKKELLSSGKITHNA